MTKKFVKQLEERNHGLRIVVRAITRMNNQLQETALKNLKDYQKMSEALYDADPVAYQRHFEKVNER